MNLEYYSSAALVTSVVVYLLAMTAYAAEWAAARKAPVEEAVGERELAAVGVSAGGSVRSSAGSGAPSTDAAVEQRMAEMKVELWGRIGVALTAVGFLCSVVGTTLRGLAADAAYLAAFLATVDGARSTSRPSASRSTARPPGAARRRGR